MVRRAVRRCGDDGDHLFHSDQGYEGFVVHDTRTVGVDFYLYPSPGGRLLHLLLPSLAGAPLVSDQYFQGSHAAGNFRPGTGLRRKRPGEFRGRTSDGLLFLYGLRRQRQRVRNLPDGFAERACPDALHLPGSFGRGDDRRPDHFAEGPGRYQDLGGSGPSGCRRRDVRFVGAGPEYRACFVVPRYRNRQCDAAGTEALARETLR